VHHGREVAAALLDAYADVRAPASAAPVRSFFALLPALARDLRGDLLPALPRGEPVRVELRQRSLQRSHVLERAFLLMSQWPLGLLRTRAVVRVASDVVTEPARVPLRADVVRAIASRCRTALVEPPTAMITAMAFSKASRVSRSSGRILLAIASTSTSAERAALSAFSGSSAAMVELPGRLMPIASIAELMVLAVNMPPQLPAPRQAFFSTAVSRSSSILPAVY
jgi:hypothetical protein